MLEMIITAAVIYQKETTHNFFFVYKGGTGLGIPEAQTRDLYKCPQKH